jgi:tetratricopeptide (TPR) repeat protein
MKYKNLLFLLIFVFSLPMLKISAQNFGETHRKIRQSVENRDYAAAENELKALQKSDKKLFEANNYDYLLARMAEKRGDFAVAAANFQAVANRNSVLKEYALWHLALIARNSGNLLLERLFLQEIQIVAPESLLAKAVNARMARSFFEGKNYDSAIRLLENDAAIENQRTKDKGQRTKD